MPVPRPLSIARARALVSGIERRAARIDASAAPPIEDLEELITAAAGVRLSLEAERTRARRHAEDLRAQDREEALAEVERLREREALFADEAARLKGVIGQLNEVRAHLRDTARGDRPQT